MFTGIIKDIGQVIALTSTNTHIELTIKSILASSATRGDSISINGTCLTVTSTSPTHFNFEAVQETVNKTNLSTLRNGSFVNLEPALTPSSLMGGHIVQGHVDETGTIIQINKKNKATEFHIKCSHSIMKHLVSKGSVTINGVSLTITGLNNDYFCISVIPTTMEDTTFHLLREGDGVNLEIDIIGKYIYSYVHQNQEITSEKANINRRFLTENGF
jgi:riboflavin synthase